MLLHSAQKCCQEATWEFPEREIELVLTQAEQKAVAELDYCSTPGPGCREDTGTCFPLWQQAAEVPIRQSPQIILATCCRVRCQPVQFLFNLWAFGGGLIMDLTVRL